jgi:outer membrane lipoprotein SlyB
MKKFTRTYLTVVAGLAVSTLLSACNPPGEPIASDSASTGNNRVNAPAAIAAPVVCNECGSIINIEEMKAKGEGSGIGAAVGAVAGAVIGHQIGDGRGNDAATATGAIGGGIAGHQIEKRIKGTTFYRVTVSMENGGTQLVDVEALNGLAVGSKVKVVGNNLVIAG